MGKLVICGLEDEEWSISEAVEMNCQKSVAEVGHLMVGFKPLKKNKVVGKVLRDFDVKASYFSPTVPGSLIHGCFIIDVSSKSITFKTMKSF